MRRMGVGGCSGYSAPPSDDDDVGEHELCPQVQAWVEARSAREYGTALHESGHCVAALALRKLIDSLVLFSDRAGVFRHYPPAKSAPTPPSKPVVIEPSDPAPHDSITIDLAGLAAEMKAPIGSTDFAAGISGDMGQVHRLLDRHCVNAAQKRFLIWYCTDRAHDIINANWPIVEALARALQYAAHVQARHSRGCAQCRCCWLCAAWRTAAVYAARSTRESADDPYGHSLRWTHACLITRDRVKDDDVAPFPNPELESPWLASAALPQRSAGNRRNGVRRSITAAPASPAPTQA
jgi:hypothetical protein